MPGDAFKARIEPVLRSVGEFPHAALNFEGLRSGPKPQVGRLLKAQCGACGYTVRVTRRWLDVGGAPLCPCNEEAMGVHVGTRT